MRVALPELVRRSPGRVFELRYSLLSPCPAAPVVSATEAGVRWGLRSTPDVAGTFELSWRTMVFGIVARDVDEDVHLSVSQLGQVTMLVLRCVPQRTHDAHAAGAAAVLGLAGLLWVVGGWSTGALPAATTVAAGGLLTDSTREIAMATLERRLRRLLVDIGGEMWPDLQAEILPRPGRSIGRGIPYP